MKKNKPEFIPFIQRCAQFEADKLKSAPVIAPQTTVTTTSAPAPVNPYALARERILTGYEKWRRNEVLGLEAKKDINNRHYITFVKEVAEMGDTLSS